MSKNKKRKNTSSPKTSVVRRNPLALNPLLKKSHAHSDSNKAKRSKDKQALKKQLKEG